MNNQNVTNIANKIYELKSAYEKWMHGDIDRNAARTRFMSAAVDQAEMYDPKELVQLMEENNKQLKRVAKQTQQSKQVDTQQAPDAGDVITAQYRGEQK